MILYRRCAHRYLALVFDQPEWEVGFYDEFRCSLGDEAKVLAQFSQLAFKRVSLLGRQTGSRHGWSKRLNSFADHRRSGRG